MFRLVDHLFWLGNLCFHPCAHSTRSVSVFSDLKLGPQQGSLMTRAKYETVKGSYGDGGSERQTQWTLKITADKVMLAS